MPESRITITPRIARGVYFKFKSLCHAHRISVERGIEEALRRALERAAIDVREDSAETAAKGLEDAEIAQNTLGV